MLLLFKPTESSKDAFHPKGDALISGFVGILEVRYEVNKQEMSFVTKRLLFDIEQAPCFEMVAAWLVDPDGLFDEVFLGNETDIKAGKFGNQGIPASSFTVNVGLPMRVGSVLYPGWTLKIAIYNKHMMSMPVRVWLEGNEK